MSQSRAKLDIMVAHTKNTNANPMTPWKVFKRIVRVLYIIDVLSIPDKTPMMYRCFKKEVRERSYSHWYTGYRNRDLLIKWLIRSSLVQAFKSPY